MENDEDLDNIDNKLKWLKHNKKGRKSSSQSGKGTSFKCDFCTGEFKQIYDLKDHLVWHAKSAENDKKSGPYFCQACSKSFLVQDKLLDHIKQHHKLLKSNRRSTITSMQSAKIPKETLSNESEKKYLWKGKKVLGKKCNVCSRAVHPASYANHIKHCLIPSLANKKNSSKPMNLKSEKQCSRKFQQIDMIFKGEAEELANQISKYKCRMCPSAFRDKSYRNMHEKKAHYSKEVPTYECHLCEETVAKSEKLSHLRSMHPSYIERYKCDICQKSFSSKIGMINHKRTQHLNYCLYVCHICEETFTSMDHLKYHESLHRKGIK